ncbi:uncharacterized protein LOC135696359 [Rhopilema esculentum]|uniref:uncharacterized protein LOC135696359 n=1 Tax=Rhopilema esculentum TaxID=499914 RepID=UPI0031D5262D|eukprot:gene12193-2811_t
MVMKWWKIRKTNLRYDTNRLNRDDEIKSEYQEEMRKYVRTNTYDETKSPQENWNNIQKGMKEAAEKKVGYPRKVGNTYEVYDGDIQELSNRQKKIRIEIDNTKEPVKKKELKAERNRIQHQISHKVQEIREKEIDMKIEDIENSSDISKMFKAVGTLYRQRYENPKVEGDEGRLATSPNDILKLTTDFFKAKFQKEDAEVIQPFEGEPRPLVKEKTPEEIHKSSTKLNNNKATGEDGIPGELLIYSPKEVKYYIAQMICLESMSH